MIAPIYPTLGGIHRAPIIIPAWKVKRISGYELEQYRVFRSSPTGKAVTIPFQIDEMNSVGDFVLPKGSAPNHNTGNKIFDVYDELSIMGQDVGPNKEPTVWDFDPPTYLYQLTFSKNGKSGAIYIGIYFKNPPPLSQKKYIIFDSKEGNIRTSRYNYKFDNKNHLITKSISLQDKKTNSIGKELIDSSTFAMKADLKYFLTLKANHRSVESRQEAWKSGPIRTIIRVDFVYNFLKLKIKIGMYTEVSFFANAVVLPAIIYNPLDSKNLNSGSSFYYGFKLVENPSSLNIQTNMPKWKPESLFDILLTKNKKQSKYWVSMHNNDAMLYFELILSKQMINLENIPKLYQKNIDGPAFTNISNDKIFDIDNSPINIGIHFDLKKFNKGDNLIAFYLFFENEKNLKQLEEMKNRHLWQYTLKRIPISKQKQ